MTVLQEDTFTSGSDEGILGFAGAACFFSFRLPNTVGLSLLLALSMLSSVASAHRGFHSGIVLQVDGEDYYLMGPPIEEGSDVLDVPGHEWVVAGPDRVVGKHYNAGPFGARHH